MLDFHRFWSVDDKQIHTEYSALRSIVMADFDEVVRYIYSSPLCAYFILPCVYLCVCVRVCVDQDADQRARTGPQEVADSGYVEYYGGAGVQHIALNVNDIIDAVTKLRVRLAVCMSFRAHVSVCILRRRAVLSSCRARCVL